jgi:hypothetical protein
MKPPFPRPLLTPSEQEALEPSPLVAFLALSILASLAFLLLLWA